MAELLTNVAVQDNYSNGATLGPALDVKQLVFQVFSEPVYARFFKPQAGDSRAQPTEDPTEHYFPVGTLLSVDGCAGVQFRNAIPGQNATVNAEIAFVGDPLFDFQSSGLFSAAVLTLSFLHNNALVGAESALDFEDSNAVVWTVTDTPGTKEAVSAALAFGSVTASGFTFAANVFGGSMVAGMGGDGASPAFGSPGAAAGAALNSGGVLQASRSGGTGTAALTITQPGADTQFRFIIDVNGRLQWGSGAAGGDTLFGRVVNSPSGTGSFLELTAGSGLGYGVGTGGTVTIVSGSSNTLNKPTGKVTASAAVATGATGSYTVLNSVVGAQDVIIVNQTNGGGNIQRHFITAVAAGSFTIFYENSSGVSVTPTFNFAVIKGSQS